MKTMVMKLSSSIRNFHNLRSDSLDGDYDYLDSNEEESRENELEGTHIKFEPLTHKSENEDFDETEVDFDQKVNKFPTSRQSF